LPFFFFVSSIPGNLSFPHFLEVASGSRASIAEQPHLSPVGGVVGGRDLFFMLDKKVEHGTCILEVFVGLHTIHVMFVGIVVSLAFPCHGLIESFRTQRILKFKMWTQKWTE
jgi:hypothetical protein